MVVAVAAVCLFVGVVVGMFIPFGRSELPPRHRRLLDRSMLLLWRIQNPTDLDRLDALSDQSRKEIDKLLEEYEKEVW